MKDTARTVLTEAGINVDTALKRFLDDEEMYFEFLNSFVEDTLMSRLKQAVQNGSVVITVKASVMEKLSVGSHTLKATYMLGEATSSVTIAKQAQAPTTPAAPSTGKANPKTGVNL